jgi:hypothetical protein
MPAVEAAIDPAHARPELFTLAWRERTAGLSRGLFQGRGERRGRSRVPALPGWQADRSALSIRGPVAKHQGRPMPVDVQSAGPDGPTTYSETPGREPGRAKLKRASEAVSSRAQSFADAAQRQAGAAQAWTLQTIRERPATALGSTAVAALLAGVLIGFGLGQALSDRD